MSWLHTHAHYIYRSWYYMCYCIHVPCRSFSNTLQWRHNEHNCVSNRQPHDCLLNRLFRRRSMKTSKPRATGLCVGNSPVTGEFPAQMASNAENVSIWWRHHEPVDVTKDVLVSCVAVIARSSSSSCLHSSHIVKSTDWRQCRTSWTIGKIGSWPEEYANTTVTLYERHGVSNHPQIDMFPTDCWGL